MINKNKNLPQKSKKNIFIFLDYTIFLPFTLIIRYKIGNLKNKDSLYFGISRLFFEIIKLNLEKLIKLKPFKFLLSLNLYEIIKQKIINFKIFFNEYFSLFYFYFEKFTIWFTKNKEKIFIFFDHTIFLPFTILIRYKIGNLNKEGSPYIGISGLFFDIIKLITNWFITLTPSKFYENCKYFFFCLLEAIKKKLKNLKFLKAFELVINDQIKVFLKIIKWLKNHHKKIFFIMDNTLFLPITLLIKINKIDLPMGISNFLFEIIKTNMIMRFEIISNFLKRYENFLKKFSILEYIFNKYIFKKDIKSIILKPKPLLFIKITIKLDFTKIPNYLVNYDKNFLLYYKYYYNNIEKLNKMLYSSKNKKELLFLNSNCYFFKVIQFSNKYLIIFTSSNFFKKVKFILNSLFKFINQKKIFLSVLKVLKVILENFIWIFFKIIKYIKKL